MAEGEGGEVGGGGEGKREQVIENKDTGSDSGGMSKLRGMNASAGILMLTVPYSKPSFNSVNSV